MIRHARARRCRVTLREDARELRLTIEDDGVGGEAAEGAGLSGMRARVAAARRRGRPRRRVRARG